MIPDWHPVGDVDIRPKRAIFARCAKWCASIADSSFSRPSPAWRCGCCSFFASPALPRTRWSMATLRRTGSQHGVYGITDTGKIVATSIRLPGYPAFLAAVFSIFGMEHYRAALLLQIALDLGSCFLIADLARRAVSPRTAKVAFLLAALCPFLADYAAAALTETLEIFFTVLALDCACRRACGLGPTVPRSLVGIGRSGRSRDLAAPGRRFAAAGDCTLPASASIPRLAGGAGGRGVSGTAPSRAASWGRRSLALARASGALDAAQPAHPQSVPTACAPLRQREKRVRSDGVQPLGKNLDGRLCVGRRDLLVGAWRLHRRREPSPPRL